MNVGNVGLRNLANHPSLSAQEREEILRYLSLDVSSEEILAAIKRKYPAIFRPTPAIISDLSKWTGFLVEVEGVVLMAKRKEKYIVLRVADRTGGVTVIAPVIAPSETPEIPELSKVKVIGKVKKSKKGGLVVFSRKIIPLP